MIVLILSLLPFIVEVLKYSSFIHTHFFISAENLSNILLIIGLVIYYRSRKNWVNYLFLLLYPLSALLHLTLKYTDELYYPNYVYSHFGIDWGPLGHISQRLLLYFFFTEYLKKYHEKVTAILRVWWSGLAGGTLFRKAVVSVMILFSIAWLVEANKIIYNRQLEVVEYVFLNPDRLSREIYIRNKSIGGFYLEIKSVADYLGNNSAFLIPPQSSDWPYEGNMPLMRGIVYPDPIARLSQTDTPSGRNLYVIITCGYKFNNSGSCFPPVTSSVLDSRQIFMVNNKGQITRSATGSFELIKNTDNLLFARVN